MRTVAVGDCVVVLVDAPGSSTILTICAAEPGGDGRDLVGSDKRRSWRRCRRRRPHAELAHAWVRAAARLHVVARCRAARCLVVHAAVVVLFGAALAAIRVPLPVPHLLHSLAVLAVVVVLAARVAVLRQPVADPEVDVALRVGDVRRCLHGGDRGQALRVRDGHDEVRGGVARDARGLHLIVRTRGAGHPQAETGREGRRRGRAWWRTRREWRRRRDPLAQTAEFAWRCGAAPSHPRVCNRKDQASVTGTRAVAGRRAMLRRIAALRIAVPVLKVLGGARTGRGHFCAVEPMVRAVSVGVLAANPRGPLSRHDGDRRRLLLGSVEDR